MYNLLPRLIKKVKKLGSIFLFRNSSLTDVSLSVATLSRLLSTSQEAALSGLLFENCAGQSASSLFIDSSSSVSLTTPIASSFSVCSSPCSSVNGDISTVFLPHAASITIDPEDGTDEQFCWSTSVGCQSLSGIVDRLMPIKKTIAITGLGSARSLMVMQSTAQSFAHLTDGSISPEVVLRCERWVSSSRKRRIRTSFILWYQQLQDEWSVDTVAEECFICVDEERSVWGCCDEEFLDEHHDD
ncbi:hypothetical protein BLNAU_21962 [Blattamonas nauphoetae]|uniref:Uncharacterized protein n=1 Tax=Blattamonas nauphoetae TaxID=2049346 RepID=A0ABQ9WYP7_9EUKA|nr:hypothetical protein BLNAU_21962 [Blattamonas nauphoetae]